MVERHEVIDVLVQQATRGRLFDDARDRASPAFDLGNESLLVAISIGNFSQIEPLLAAAVYRSRLKAMSDDELTREVGMAIALRKDPDAATQEGNKSAAILREALREWGRKGGRRSKLNPSVLEASRELYRQAPDLSAKAAWHRVRKHDNTISIGQSAFQKNYWPPPS